MQLLNAVREIPEAVRNGPSGDRIIGGLQGIFGYLGSPHGAPYSGLQVTLETIFIALDKFAGGGYSIGRQGDASWVVRACLRYLGGDKHAAGIDAEVGRLFKFERCEVEYHKNTPDAIERVRSILPVEVMLDLFVQRSNPKGEVVGFWEALGSLEERQEGSDGKACRKQFAGLPEVLFVKLLRLDETGMPTTDGEISVRIPSEFEMPGEMVYSGLPAPVRYRLMGGIVRFGLSMGSGHYVAYIRNSANPTEFFLFDDDSVQGVSAEEALEALRARGYVFAFRKDG
jgi:hypothetical protein